MPRRRGESRSVEVDVCAHNVRGIRVDPEEDALEEAVETKRGESAAQADHAQEAGHVGVVDLLVAEERLVGGHFRDGGDDLVAGCSLGIFECAVDLGNGHASELQDVDRV